MNHADPSAAAIARLTTRTLATVSVDLALSAFTASFAGYQVPITMTAAQFDARFRSENVDAFASRVYFSDDEPVAILVVARRGWTSRVAAMGIVPRMRGCGLGLDVMRSAVTDAGERGDVGLLLEAIESNVRAVKLYRRAGFEVDRALLAFSIDAEQAAPASADLQEIDPAAGALRAAAFETGTSPWQLQPPSLAAMVRPTRCFIDGRRSIVAFVDPGHEPVRLRAVAFEPDVPAAASAAFTSSLRAHFPGRPWFAPPIFTDAHHVRFFAPGGWELAGIRQVEMRHRLEMSPSTRNVDAK